MYLETIKSTKKGKTYFSYLIRESYREKGKVKHRTIANLSKLSQEHIIQIKNIFADKKGDFDISDLENGNSYEYGASYSFLTLSRDIGLDKMIY